MKITSENQQTLLADLDKLRERIAAAEPFDCIIIQEYPDRKAFEVRGAYVNGRPTAQCADLFVQALHRLVYGPPLDTGSFRVMKIEIGSIAQTEVISGIAANKLPV